MRKIILGFFVFYTVYGFSQTSVLTQHNDKGRTGWNNQEKRLHTKNVNTNSFGLLFTREVDDQIYSQPLVAQITINGKIRNVVFVATVSNSIYAFDGDSAALSNPYWMTNLNPPGWRAMKNTDSACGIGNYNDFSGNIGIVGTPVIDMSTNTIYVVSKSANGPSGSASFQQNFHALDLITGKEKFGGPVAINAQISGSGAGSVSGVIHFDPQLENQRAGLLLLNGVVYVAWASHGDCGNYHGWIIGFDKTTLATKYIYNTTPQGSMGGIWMSAAGLSADANGNIYASVGNGSVGISSPNDTINRGESMIRLTPKSNTLSLTSFFTPNNFSTLNQYDEDFGVSGMLLLPGRKQAFSGAKDGNIYLTNQDTLGGYNGIANKVAQTFTQGYGGAHNIGSLNYYKGSTHEWVYIWSDNAPLQALPYDSTIKKFNLSNVKTSSSSVNGPTGYNGAFMSVSSNGKIDSTAILWVNHAVSTCNANQSVCPGILRAINANNITQELWNSLQNPNDNFGSYAKFTCPTIANGKIFLATFSNKLAVYGLHKDLILGVVPAQEQLLKIFPNPASSIINIQSNNSIRSVVIYDLNGRAVWSGNSFQNSEIEIRFSLPGGLYVIQTQTENMLYRRIVAIKP